MKVPCYSLCKSYEYKIYQIGLSDTGKYPWSIFALTNMLQMQYNVFSSILNQKINSFLC